MTNLAVAGALVLLGVVLLLPFGDAYLKLFLIAVGTLVLALGVIQAVSKRRPERPPAKTRFYTGKPL